MNAISYKSLSHFNLKINIGLAFVIFQTFRNIKHSRTIFPLRRFIALAQSNNKNARVLQIPRNPFVFTL